MDVSSSAETSAPYILLVETEHFQQGLVVDQVGELLSFQTEQIQNSFQYGSEAIIKGSIQHGNELIFCPTYRMIFGE